MTIKLNWWLGVALFTLLFSVFALLGWYARDQTFKPVIVDRIAEKVVTQNITEYVPCLVIFPVETTFVSYATGNLTLNDVLSILESGKKNHQYYIDHPEKQSEVTGNTAFNELWVNNYTAIAAYIGKASKQPTQGRDMGE